MSRDNLSRSDVRRIARREAEKAAAEVEEQLAEQLAAAGIDPDAESGADDWTDADDLAFEVLTGSDIRQMGDTSPREYVKEQYGVDPAAVESRAELRERVEQSG